MKSSSISVILFFIVGLGAGVGISYFYFSGFETGAVSEKIRIKKEVETSKSKAPEQSIGPIKKSNKLVVKPTEIELVSDSLLSSVDENGHDLNSGSHSKEEKLAADSLALQKVSKKIDSAQTAKNQVKLGDGDDIVIETEELIETFKCTLVDLSSTTESRKKQDSLAATIAGVPTSSKQVYTVEYWVSPLNFKGYKMANNKVVIYGFQSKESFKLMKLESSIYAMYEGVFYSLKNTYDYLPLKKVVDETVLLKLKQL